MVLMRKPDNMTDEQWGHLLAEFARGDGLYGEPPHIASVLLTIVLFIMLFGGLFFHAH